MGLSLFHEIMKITYTIFLYKLTNNILVTRMAPRRIHLSIILLIIIIYLSILLLYYRYILFENIKTEKNIDTFYCYSFIYGWQ